MKTKKITTKIVVAVIAFILALFVGLPFYAATTSAFGESTGFGETESNSVSSVLSDLRKDSNFDENDYPMNANDYNLYVIQIAESVNKDLLVYVYQPSAGNIDLTANFISISKTVYGNEVWYRYNLTPLSSESVFCKYKVEAFELENGTVRYYNISAIYRPYNSAIDGKTDSSSPVDGIAYEVGQQWKACTVDGNITYSMMTTETITLTNQWCGHIQYSNGYFGDVLLSNCDAWFFVLKADMRIDRLMEADVTYSWTSYQYKVNYLSGEETTTPIKTVDNEFVALTDAQQGGTEADGWFGHKWEWNRIVPISDFLSDVGDNLTDDCKSHLSSSEFNGGWVLRFTETRNDAYTIESPVNGITMQTAYYHDYTDISNVTVLRLKFLKDGVTYNLGVVSNSVNPDNFPDGEYDTGDGIKENLQDIVKSIEDFFNNMFDNVKTFFQKLLTIIGIVFAGVVLLLLLPYIWKFLIWLITSPFKLLGKLFKKKE